MNHLSSIVIPASIILSAVGCMSASVPPATQAARVEQQQCSGTIAQADEQILKNTTVLNVSPIYGHVHTSYNDYEARVNGATLVIEPPPGVTPEQMARILQCHCARTLLGQIDQAQVQNDPYSLPNKWLDIDVKPEAGKYTVSVNADSVQNGLDVLARAKSRVATTGTPAP